MAARPEREGERCQSFWRQEFCSARLGLEQRMPHRRGGRAVRSAVVNCERVCQARKG